ncbi:MAG: hypothetical protein QOE65_3143 [Solirubrobacteraceae bacterium]|jgi:hypothetical protein|nr:hypothetical protein [Solirubrobacteraceae bacterium]
MPSDDGLPPAVPSGADGLLAEISRRGLLKRGGLLGLAALIASARPLIDTIPATAEPALPDATLQAFADTILPGRIVTRTDLGNEVHPQAIAGVDPEPGAVEADVLALYHHPKIGFDALQGPFLADLESRALGQGGSFLSLPFDKRTAVCVAGLDFKNPARVVWEAAAAVPFTAFCAAALIPNATAAKASGLRVMGLPGVAPRGYRDFSYNRRLSRERTRLGYLD